MAEPIGLPIETLRRLAEIDEGMVVGHPEREASADEQTAKYSTTTEYLDRIQNDWRKTASETAAELPGSLATGDPAVDTLFDEVQQCWLMGCHGAAITLASILVEHALKKAAYLKHKGGYENFDLEEWEHEARKKTFHPTVMHAHAEGLIDDRERSELLRFKDQVRNPYSHYNIERIVKEVTALPVEKIDLATGVRSQITINAGEHAGMHFIAKRIVDRSHAREVVWFAGLVTRHVFSTLDAMLDGLSESDDRDDGTATAPTTPGPDPTAPPHS